MNKLKRILCIIIAMMLQSACVHAASLNYGFNMEYSKSLVTIEGTTTPDDYISIEIVPATVDPEELWNSIDSTKITNISDGIRAAYNAGKLTFLDLVSPDAKGNFSVPVTIDTLGDYQILIYSSEDDTVYRENIFFTDQGSYQVVMNALNGYLSADEWTEFQNLVDQSKDYIGFHEATFSKVTDDAVIRAMYDELRRTGTRFKENDSSYNIDFYRTIALMIGLNEGVDISDIPEIVQGLSITDATVDEYIDKVLITNSAKTQFVSLLTRKSIKDFDDLKKKVKEALILTTVKYPNGWANIQALFNRYGSEVLGLSSVSAKGSVYEKLAGNSYNTIGALVATYNSYSDSAGGSGGSGSSSGGSGGSSSGGGKELGIGGAVGGSFVSAGETGVLSMPFIDLNPVPWAYSAISTLYTAGIINGVSTDKFMPDKNVKREEFVKMLIAAMGLPLEETGNDFQDVTPGSWYETYVKTAHNNQLVSGMPSNMFGVGLNISRQDMAVMVLNAMKKKGYTETNPTLGFADADQTADYAKAAVAELASLGIVNGVDDTHFNPTGVATRAQAAVIINRALSYLK